MACGDFNCSGPQTRTIDDHLVDIILRYKQKQLVSEPTNEAGNLLDWHIVLDTNLDAVKNVLMYSLCFSDHTLVCCQLVAEWQPSAASINNSYLPIKQIDISVFRSIVLTSSLHNASDLESLASDYTALFDKEMTRILNVCAPIRSAIKQRGAHDVHQLQTR